jgi:1-acyl-sn-glycerol-3-phosphate acyltransferase
LRLNGGFSVSGRDNIPQTGGSILASNHRSYLDPPTIGVSIRRRTYYFAKQELFKNPVFGRFIRSVYAFPVDREGVDRTAIRHAINLLKSGELLTLFPEGTRSGDGTLGEPTPGVAFIAKQADVPIVPCALTGTDVVLPPKAWHLHRGRITVQFGEPVYVKDFNTAGDRKAGATAAVEAVMERIAAMLAEVE